MPTVIPKVLLVEDDNNLREIFEMRLKAEGYSTITASNGEEALVVAMKEKPDLIIADVMMPKLSGFEMLETLRATPEMAGTKTIMMTALGQAEDRARGERLGVIKYLVKSQVTLEDFVKVVRDVMSPDGTTLGAQAPPAASPANSSQVQTNKESEATVPEDTSTNPSMPAAPSGDGMTNPVSGAPADPATAQPTTGQEEQQIQDQINSFAGTTPTVDAAAPAAPAPDLSITTPADPTVTTMPMSDDTSATTAPAMPGTDTPAPAPEAPAPPAEAPSADPSQPSGPAPL